MKKLRILLILIMRLKNKKKLKSKLMIIIIMALNKLKKKNIIWLRLIKIIGINFIKTIRNNNINNNKLNTQEIGIVNKKQIIESLMKLLIIGNNGKKLKDKKITNLINIINNPKILNIFKRKKLLIMKHNIIKIHKK